jgi:hypothetical protein
MLTVTYCVWNNFRLSMYVVLQILRGNYQRNRLQRKLWVQNYETSRWRRPLDVRDESNTRIYGCRKKESPVLRNPHHFHIKKINWQQFLLERTSTEFVTNRFCTFYVPIVFFFLFISYLAFAYKVFYVYLYSYYIISFTHANTYCKTLVPTEFVTNRF